VTHTDTTRTSPRGAFAPKNLCHIVSEVIDDVQVPRLGPVLAGDQLHQPERVVREGLLGRV